MTQFGDANQIETSLITLTENGFDPGANFASVTWKVDELVELESTIAKCGLFVRDVLLEDVDEPYPTTKKNNQ